MSMPWRFVYMCHGSSFIVWKLLYESLCYERRVMCRCSDSYHVISRVFCELFTKGSSLRVCFRLNNNKPYQPRWSLSSCQQQCMYLVVCGIADFHILFFYYYTVMCTTNSCGPINVSLSLSLSLLLLLLLLLSI